MSHDTNHTGIDNDTIYCILLCMVDSTNDRTLMVRLESVKDSGFSLCNVLRLVDGISQRSITIDMRFAGSK